MRHLNLLLTLAYPPAVHFTLVSAQPGWALWLLLTLSGTQFLTILLTNGVTRATAIVPAGILALCLYGLLHGTIFALYLLPILISATLLWLFARTLRPGHEPFITTLARRVFQERDPEALHYTRRVTQLWSLFFLAMLLECLLLALFAPVELWSLFTNLLNYLFIALLFLVESTYRRLRFPQRSSPRELMQQLLRADWPGILRGQP